MQYQVYKEDTGEIVAWIDTEDVNTVIRKGYAVKAGNELRAFAENEDEVRVTKETAEGR